MEPLKSALGLCFCDGIGPGTAAKLIAACGSLEKVFEADKNQLSNMNGINKNIWQILRTKVDWARVEKEMNYIVKNNINFVLITDSAYPRLLKKIDSPPLILFFSGEIEIINRNQCISIVGTRHATSYGINMVQEFISSISTHPTCIISGLALGIDGAAHKAALANSVPTFGVVAHGLQTIYPSVHRPLASGFKKHGGGLITEFFSDESPNRENFPKRNRIIAGLSATTIVVEAADKGGALITAHYAHKYQRKVYALPGRYTDAYSAGCNDLIEKKRACSIKSVESLIADLGFIHSRDPQHKIVSVMDMPEEERLVYEILQTQNKVSLDAMACYINKDIPRCSHLLFSMEMKGLVRGLPGKIYELV